MPFEPLETQQTAPKGRFEPFGENETILHEPTGKIVSMPQGLNGDEADYLIETQVNKSDKGRFFGLVDMGADFGKGFAKNMAGWVAGIPGEIMGLEVEAGERLMARRDRIGQPPQSRPGASKIEQAFDRGIGRIPGPDDLLLDLLAKSSLPERLLGAGEVLQNTNRQFVENLGLTIDEDASTAEKVGGDFGAGAASVTTAIAMTMVTRNPAYAATFFGALQKSAIYEEAREQGLDPQEAGRLSTKAGVIEGGIEAIGNKVFLDLGRQAKPVQRILGRMAEESIQEMTQQGSEEILTRFSGVREQDLSAALKNIGYAGLIGFIVSGPGATVSTVMEQRAQKEGFSEDEARFIAETMAGKIVGREREITDTMASVLESTVSPIARDPEGEAKAQEIVQKFIDGEPIDLPPELAQAMEPLSERQQFENRLSYELLQTGKYSPEQATETATILGAAFETELQTGESADMRRMARDMFEGLRVEQGGEQQTGEFFQEGKPLSEAEKTFKNLVATEGALLKPKAEQMLQRIGIDTKAISKERDIGFGAKMPSYTHENLQQILPPDNNKEIYHSTNLGSAKVLADRFMRGTKRQDNVYVSPDRDLALGQQGNAVTLVLDPTKVWGTLPENAANEMKPGSEYVVSLSGPRSLKAIIAKQKRTLDSLAKVKILSKYFDFENAQQVEGGFLVNRKQESSSAVITDQTTQDEVKGTKYGTGQQEALFQGKPENLIRRPMTLRGFVRKHGGIRDVDGDLKAMDLHKDSRFKGVVRDEKGLHPDKMRELAEQAGYLVSDDPNATTTPTDLYNALRQEMEGTDVYSRADANIVAEYDSRLKAIEERADYQDLVDQINMYAESLQVTLSEKETGDIALLTAEGYDIEDATEIVLTESGRRQEEQDGTFERTEEDQGARGDDIPFDDLKPKEPGPGKRARDQQPEGAKRGSISFDADGTAVIRAFDNADISTILHETGHFFLEVQRRLAEHPDASNARKARWKDMLDWLGVKSADEITTAHHEKFAEGFEKYVYEGKAPSASLRDTFRKFRSWLADLWQRLPQLKPNARLSAEVRNFFDHLLATERDIKQGRKFDKSYSKLEIARMSPEQREQIRQEKLKTANSKQHRDNINRKYGPQPAYSLPKKKGTAAKAGDALKDFGKMTDNALTPISTRLKNINPKLRAKLRRFEFSLNRQIQRDQEVLVPFLEKYRAVKEADKAILDYAMKNGDIEMVEAIGAEYDMADELAEVRAALDDIYARAEAVGYELGYRENFFPRHVADPEGLVNYFEKTEAWNEISRALKEKENDLGRTLETEEKAHLINTLLRGYKTAGITLSKPGALKERSIDEVTPEINDFYNSTDQALIRYFSVVNEAVEARKFFGKGASKDSIENLEDSVGFFVINELEAGTITPAQAKELSDILKARFNRGKMGAFWKVYKNLGYIDTMGSPISAITQIGDLGYAMYNAGVYRTMTNLPRAIFGRSKVSRSDIGIERIAQEFDDSSTSGKAVSAVFKAVGLDKMDRIGKEALVNGALDKYRKLAQNPSDKFRAELELIFEGETDSVIEDLKIGRTSENVKMLLFNELLNFQPVALSEMPVSYLKMGNGRVFYMLKTFTIKQLDIYRNEVFDEIRAGNPVKGMVRLVRLAAFFAMMNAGADLIKDIMLGRDTPPEDHIINNILRLFGINKYQAYTARREGIGTAAFKSIAPPFKLIDSAYKDTAKAIDNGEVDIEELETIQSIPVGGKFYYWWFGAGSDK